MVIKGFDTATPILTQAQVNVLLNNSNYPAVFIGRYLKSTPGSNGNKHLTGTEINLLKNNNIKIVSLFEYDGSNASNYTASSGAEHALHALQAANGFTQPAGTPIYFCLDCLTPQSAIQNNISPYFNAIKQKFNQNSFNPNQYTIGIYGNAYACYCIRQEIPGIKTIVTGEMPQYNITLTDYTIRQTSLNTTIQYNGTQLVVDKCRARVSSYGGWFPAGTPGPL